MDNKKNKTKSILIAVLLLLLSGGLIFSATKIYQNSTEPISPAVPDESQAQQTTPEGCIPCDGIFFTVSAQSAPTSTPILLPTATSTPVPTATSVPVPTATTVPGQPTSTPKPTATPTTALIAQVNPTLPPSYGGAVNPTVRPTGTPKPPATATLPDAGISYPTLMLILSGSFLLVISLLII